MIVSDSSPLVVLGKEGRLTLLKKLFEQVCIPQKVYEEITEKEGSVETIAVEQGIKEKWIKVEQVKPEKLLDTKNLEAGEREAIALALAKGSDLLVDDLTARSYASLMGIKPSGILYMLISARQKKIITKREAIEMLDSTIKKGFYLSTETYKGLLEFVK